MRATVRNASRESTLRELLQAGGAAEMSRLSVRVADLESDAGWREAAAGCDAVLHMASPLPMGLPQHEDELIVPAREGAVRVLRAARDEGVRRVVLTSSFAAIGYGHDRNRTEPFDENDWTKIARDSTAYVKSKTLAERAAWEFMKREGGALELAVVNPVAVFGPVLGADYSSSVEIVARLLRGSLPAVPLITFGIVDVRDVAELHLIAMAHPAARGERFLATAGDFYSVHQVGQTLSNRLGNAAKRVPTLQLADWVVRSAALVSPTARAVLPELGKVKNGTNAKARRLLDWAPRSSEEAIVACAESLIEKGLIARH